MSDPRSDVVTSMAQGITAAIQLLASAQRRLRPSPAACPGPPARASGPAKAGLARASARASASTHRIPPLRNMIASLRGSCSAAIGFRASAPSLQATRLVCRVLFPATPFVVPGTMQALQAFGRHRTGFIATENLGMEFGDLQTAV